MAPTRRCGRRRSRACFLSSRWRLSRGAVAARSRRHCGCGDRRAARPQHRLDGSTALQALGAGTYWRQHAATTGTAVRAFDQFLNELWPRYIVVDGPAFYVGDHVLYWQLKLGEVFNHTVVGLGGQIDARWQNELQRERHPRYRFWSAVSVIEVSEQCRTGGDWSCRQLPFAGGTRYVNARPTPLPIPNGEAWIEPVAPDIAARLLPPAKAARWIIVALRPEDIALLGPIVTGALTEDNYRPFLASVVGYRASYYLLWLPNS
jgi:hypothetical protein